jgi:hypothetical protein
MRVGDAAEQSAADRAPAALAADDQPRIDLLGNLIGKRLSRPVSDRLARWRP